MKNAILKTLIGFVSAVMVGWPSVTLASVIEFDLNYALSTAPISGEFGEGQTLSGVGTFFPDDAFVFGLGDTLIFNILFDQSLQVFDFDDPTDEAFSFGLNIVSGSPGFSGTWVSSIEALGAFGDIWEGSITQGWVGGGGGFGWGGIGINVTGSQGRFDGIRWTTTLTSANEGNPMTLYAFTGFALSADGLRILPLSVPTPATLALFGIGLAGIGWSRRKKA